MSADRNEALRLADALDKMRGPHLGDGINPGVHAYQLAALLRQLSAERDRLRAEVERLSKTDAEILACNYPDGEENGPTISAPDYELIGFARQLGIRDAARTTHKETE